jgi:hypothetical protein
VDSIAATVTPQASSQSRIDSSARVVVGNVRTSPRRPRGPGVRTHTVNDALPMSSPATRSNNTSTATTPRSATDETPPGGPSARKQTHALTAAIKGAPENPAPNTSAG